ncbi:hypothetical protein EVJ58_g10209 [Rhodofomes roseus]|uniref:Uncharacterized protein n=1 Tax=Rhodofomes roseus TaxID=34475 RepID=A0A4Y9XPQ9_9APHY|nr:hypothetical protein EVJ58_g10209 [Rhodofomes roseus]
MARTTQNASKSVGLSDYRQRSNLSREQILALINGVTDDEDMELDEQEDKPESEQESNVTDHDQSSIYCYRCHNGGSLVTCCRCTRDVCAQCLGRLDFSAIQDVWSFICPVCHGEDKQLKDEPYYAFYLGRSIPAVQEPCPVVGTNIGPRKAFCSTAPVVILSFRLKSLGNRGSVPLMLRTHLESYFWCTDNLHYHDIVFDFHTVKDAAIHARRMKSLVPNVRLVTFIYTHSNVHTGDLYHAHDATSPIDEWFNIVLTDEFKVLCDKVSQHWMFILACGAIVNNNTARMHLKRQLLEYKVPFAFGFSAAMFNAHLSSDFIIHFATRVIIQLAVPLRHTMARMLNMSFSLRLHSGVIVFRYHNSMENTPSITVENYVWHHPNLAPGGMRIPSQCPDCMRLGTLKPIKSVERDTMQYFAGFKCKRCKWMKRKWVSYDPRDGNLVDKVNGKWFLDIIDPDDGEVASSIDADAPEDDGIKAEELYYARA